VALPVLPAHRRVLVGRFRRRLRDEAQRDEYNWTQISILGRLDRDDPATVSALAHAEGTRPLSMGAIFVALTTNSLMQLSAEPAWRGRVMGIRLALGITPTGVPIVGWMVDTFGSRWTIGLGAAAGIAATTACLGYVVR
jgi:hypothetical protein